MQGDCFQHWIYTHLLLFVNFLTNYYNIYHQYKCSIYVIIIFRISIIIIFKLLYLGCNLYTQYSVINMLCTPLNAAKFQHKGLLNVCLRTCVWANLKRVSALVVQEHSCWFLNKAKRKVKKQLPEKTKQMGPVPANRTSKSGNMESIFFAAVGLEKVLLRSKDEGWGLERRRTSQPFPGFLFQRFFSAVEWSAA